MTPAPAGWRRVRCWVRMRPGWWPRPRPMAAGQRPGPASWPWRQGRSPSAARSRSVRWPRSHPGRSGRGGGVAGGRRCRVAGPACCRRGPGQAGADHRRLRRGWPVRRATGGAGGCAGDRLGRLAIPRRGLAEAGADEVVVGLDGVDQPVDVVMDNVGGPLLVAAWELLAPGGSLHSIGWTAGEPAVFPPYSTVGPPKSLTHSSTKARPAASSPPWCSWLRRAGWLWRSAGAARGSGWPRRPRPWSGVG